MRGITLGVVLASLVQVGWAGVAGAQDEVSARVQQAVPAIDVRPGQDGGLRVIATNAAVEEIIGAVAAAAGVRVTTVGVLPRQIISVVFDDWPVYDVLAALLNAAGINFVLATGGPADAPVRLIMTAAGSGSVTGPQPPRPPASASVAPDTGAEPSAVAQAAADSPPNALERTGNQRDGAAQPWPDGIQPVNAGVVTLPATAEELFLAVNGSRPVSYPPDATPDIGPQLRPDQMEPVNRPGPGGVAVATAARPGELTGGGPTGRLTATPLGAAPPDPAMTVPPKTFSIPAPPMVQFPPPAR